jgi:hypothetical protein
MPSLLRSLTGVPPAFVLDGRRPPRASINPSAVQEASWLGLERDISAVKFG